MVKGRETSPYFFKKGVFVVKGVSIWKLLRDERGISATEALIVISICAATAVVINAYLTPAARTMHNTSVDRITNIVSTGY